MEATGRLSGNYRAPRNAFMNAEGSIHNDAVASKLGFKGGTVPGSVHMDQFVPMILELYGEDWFRRGHLSLYFKQAVVDGELVRAFVTPGEDRARLEMTNHAGDVICVGTAGTVAPDAASELGSRLQAPAHGEPTRRILQAYSLGDESGPVPLRLDRDAAASALARITEPLPLYQEDVLPPSQVISLTHQVRPTVLSKAGQSVGLFGALEIQHLDGPLRADADYEARTKILRFDESPKSEMVWYEVNVSEPGAEALKARAIYCIRFMKASSPLWAAA
jgi:hypothetical protein